MNFDQTLFRCSALGNLMASPVSKADKEAGNLSEGAKTHLVDIYVQNKYGRQTDISNKYTSKGLMVEEDSITLYSRVKKTFFKKNIQHLHNDFIKGTPDLYAGLEITAADKIIELKSSWDIYTFFRVHTKDLNSLYYWQLQGYMALTGAKRSSLVYCLVNTPEPFLTDEKRKLFYRMNVPTTENELYVEACNEIDKLMIYDDIPMQEKLIEISIERNDDDISRLYKKIEKARVFLNELDKAISPQPSVLIAEHQPELQATIIETA